MLSCDSYIRLPHLSSLVNNFFKLFFTVFFQFPVFSTAQLDYHICHFLSIHFFIFFNYFFQLFFQLFLICYFGVSFHAYADIPQINSERYLQTGNSEAPLAVSSPEYCPGCVRYPFESICIRRLSLHNLITNLH